MIEQLADFLDLSDTECPQTFLFAKLAFGRLQSGEALTIQLSSYEQLRDVAQSLEEEGASVTILSKADNSQHFFVEVCRRPTNENLES